MLHRWWPWLSFVGLVLCLLLVPAVSQAQWACPPGYHPNRYGQCVPYGMRPVICPPGYVLNPYGQCMMPAPVVQQCPPGYHPSRYGQCVPFGGYPRGCPPGYRWYHGRCFPGY